MFLGGFVKKTCFLINRVFYSVTDSLDLSRHFDRFVNSLRKLVANLWYFIKRDKWSRAAFAGVLGPQNFLLTNSLVSIFITTGDRLYLQHS